MRRNLVGKKGSQNLNAGWSSTYLTNYTTSVTAQFAHSRASAAAPTMADTEWVPQDHWVPLTDTATNPVRNSDCVAYTLAGLLDRYLTETYTSDGLDIGRVRGGSFYTSAASYPNPQTTDTNLVNLVLVGDGAVFNNGDSFDVSIAADLLNDPIVITGASQLAASAQAAYRMRIVLEASSLSSLSEVDVTFYGQSFNLGNVSGGGDDGNVRASWSSQARKNAGFSPDIFEFHARDTSNRNLDWSMTVGDNGGAFDGTIKEIHFDQSEQYAFCSNFKVRFVEPTTVHVYRKSTQTFHDVQLSDVTVNGSRKMTYYDLKDGVFWESDRAFGTSVLYGHGLLDIREVVKRARTLFNDSSINANDLDVYLGVKANWNGGFSSLWNLVASGNGWSEEVAALGWGVARVQCSTLQIKCPTFDRDFVKGQWADQTFERQVNTASGGVRSVGSSPYNTNKSFAGPIDVSPSNGFLVEGGPAIVFGGAVFRDIHDTLAGAPTGTDADRQACGDPVTNGATYTGVDVYGVNSGQIGFPQSKAGNEWYGRNWRLVTFIDVQEPGQNFDTSEIDGTNIDTLNPWSHAEFVIGYYS